MRCKSVAIVLLCAAAIGGFLSTKAEAAGLLVAEGGFGGVLEIKEQDVRVVINNGIAVTEVNQIFVNTEDRLVEALYLFPVPKGASVSNFSMWIGGKEMIGEVVEKQRAREIYESYKQTRQDPGLLEQVDYKTFEMRIFPIPARAEQRIRVTYYQELDFDHDQATYVYPLATVARNDIDQRTTGKFALTLDVKSEVPITSLESPSHGDEFVVVNHTSNYRQASMELSGGDLSRDVVLAFETSRPRTGIDVITSKQSGEDGYFMLTLTAGEELAELNRGMDYVFVLDVSGSMANDGKLQLSRNSVFAFMKSLGEEDRFEVMSFNAATNTLFAGLQPTSAQRLQQAQQFLDEQRARGGTVLRPAISAAYRYQDSDRILNVVVLSDGMTEQSEQRELLQLIGERPAGCRVFCVGVGNEVNRPLLQQLADEAGGLAAFVSREDGFERQAQAFRRKLMRPAMRDVRIVMKGADVYDVEPQELPDLFHGAPLRIYGRYKNAGDTQAQITGDVQGAMIEQAIDINLARENTDNPEIERMWAWHRVQRLFGEERAAGNAQHQSEIVRLSEGYSIANQYASFIVLENDAEYQRWKIERRNASRIEKDRAAQQRVRQQLDQLRQQAVADLAPTNAPASANSATRSNHVNSPSRSNSRDLFVPSTESSNSNTPTNNRNRGGGGGGVVGGGALGPISGLLALGLGGAVAATRRRKRRLQND